METTVILSRTHSSKIIPYKTNFRSPRFKARHDVKMNVDFNRTVSNFSDIKQNFTFTTETNMSYWNQSDFFHNLTNNSELEYDYQTLNTTAKDDLWSSCKEWTPAQHNLFQTANFFFAAAFLVPGNFKQSVLLVR